MFGPDNETLAKVASMPTAQAIVPDSPDNKASEQVMERHNTLMDCLREEGELQAEERMQAAIDGDYYDHLQWREEDAAVLMARGQAPLVFNESRQTIDWMCGMQKRMRTDGNVLPRTEKAQASAEAKTKVMKYVGDANLEQWHVSFAYKQAVLGGLGWLEEGINTEPGEEVVFTGSEDWRNVFRDSRSRHFDINVDSRYLFRKKRMDLDYSIALLPHAKQHLVQMAGKDGDVRADDVWYLGERLTGSTDITGAGGYLPHRYRDRSAYIGGVQTNDRGRRLSLDLMEAWYRVPEAVKVFAGGPLRGQEFIPNNEGHEQLKRDRWSMFGAVVNRMRVMICTDSAPVWDGKSPFKHNNFLLVPVWGYRRGRDGMAYGLMRGMRDLNDDLNKRASKALHSASSNRVVAKKGVFPDVEQARDEAARPDMFLEVNNIEDVRFEKPTADMQMNLELIAFDREMIRNSGGVTDANLGRDSKAESGVAIGKQQDQGALTTSEFPDNLRLALQIARRMRLSHIEQFKTQAEVIRIAGDGAPIEWLPINQPQEDGTTLNALGEDQADYIIAERDYRESFAQAALAEMMELLGKIGGFAPEVVLAVLDLVVDSAEIKNKDEWVSRLRKLNGQRDPKKKPTPEELQAQEQEQADNKRAKAIQLDTLQAQLDKLRAEVGKLDTASILARVESMFSALQAAQVVALTPGVAPIADVIAAGAGFQDQGGQDPNLPAPAVATPMPTSPAQAMPVDPQQGQQPGADPAAAAAMSATGLEGMQQGMQTPVAADNGPAV